MKLKPIMDFGKISNDTSSWKVSRRSERARIPAKPIKLSCKPATNNRLRAPMKFCGAFSKERVLSSSFEAPAISIPIKTFDMGQKRERVAFPLRFSRITHIGM